MRALRYHGREDLRVDDVPEPHAAAAEVVLEVAWCGICGTDLHEYLTGPTIITREPHPATGGRLPMTVGHELSGRVVEVGPGVDHLREGERVVVDPCIACGACWYCRTGETVRCDRIAYVGMHRDGGMARYVAVPANLVHALPDAVSDEAGALIEPLTVGMRAVRRSGLRAGDCAAVVGAGPIGLLTLAVARAAGAGEVHVVERSPTRRRVALDLGATRVHDPADGDPAEQVRAATTAGRGADVAFECVGLGVTLAAAIGATRKGGTTVVLGFFDEPATVNVNDVLLSERTVRGSTGSVDDFPRTIALVADGRIDVTPLISDRLALADAVERGFGSLVRSRDAHVKILVGPR
jgi:(R,R)-butanediol dehydrogenase / meso-butanediol dehydrogenase / diacetyl reductase